MSNISQKQRLIENYTILALECLCIIASFFLGVLTRGIEASYLAFSKTYITTIACILFFHLLSYYLFDWNINIFKRGYYIELVAVFKYNLVLIIFLGFFLYVSKMAIDFSRLVFVYFFFYNIILTYLGHLLLKKYFTNIYRTSSSSSKMFVITTSPYAEMILKSIASSSEWSFEVTGIALMDENHMGSNILNIPVIANGEDLFEQFKTKVVDEVFIHLPDYSKERIEDLIIKF